MKKLGLILVAAAALSMTALPAFAGNYGSHPGYGGGQMHPPSINVTANGGNAYSKSYANANAYQKQSQSLNNNISIINSASAAGCAFGGPIGCGIAAGIQVFQTLPLIFGAPQQPQVVYRDRVVVKVVHCTEEMMGSPRCPMKDYGAIKSKTNVASKSVPTPRPAPASARPSAPASAPATEQPLQVGAK